MRSGPSTVSKDRSSQAGRAGQSTKKSTGGSAGSGLGRERLSNCAWRREAAYLGTSYGLRAMFVTPIENRLHLLPFS